MNSAELASSFIQRVRNLKTFQVQRSLDDPLSFWPSAFIGLTIWYFLLIKSHLRSRIYISYVFGLGILLPVQHWTGIYVGNIPWLILCFAQAFIFMLPAFFVGKRKKFNQCEIWFNTCCIAIHY